jgi:hypothetical protein
MSSSRKDNGGKAEDRLITVTTNTLKERLNKAYTDHRSRSTQIDSFERLWDLKEMALLEGKPSIEVPQTWLDELDRATQRSTKN